MTKLLRAGVAAQKAIFSEPWDERSRVRIRMALHTGEAEERDGDYFGPPLNRVSRLLSAGHGGQSLISKATKELVEEHLPQEVALRDMGERRLKDLKEPERIFQLLAPDLPAEFPPLKTLETSSNEDRYRLIEKIGSGGMAEVYLAYDEFLQREVAFKVLDRKYAENKEAIERFRREARNAASLRHPNIVATHDRGETENGTYYIVMEYLEGGTLEDLIQEAGPIPPREAAEIALEIADALTVAHENDVIHRDIKPQNILLTKTGEAKVADFGIARAASATTMTQAGSILGTVHYISPEQALGELVSPKSDLYSLGVVLYEMLTGELPYEAETPVGVVMKHVSGISRSPRDADPSVPEEMDTVAGRLLSRNPEERYPDAVTLAEDLRTVAEGLPEVPEAEGARAAGVRAARSKRGTRSGTSGRELGTGAGAAWARPVEASGGGLQGRGVLLLALALVLVSIGVIAFVALGREDQPTGAGAAQLEGKKLPEAGTFPPGAYKTDEFRPAFSFDLPGGKNGDWKVESAEQADYLELSPTRFPIFNDFDRVPPQITFVNSSKVYSGEGGEDLVSVPDDMAAWVRDHPGLRVDQEEPVSVGGVAGTWLRGRVSPEDDVSLFRTSTGVDATFSVGNEFGMVVLDDVADETVVVLVEGTKDQLDEKKQEEGETLEPLLPKAKEMLASLEFADPGDAPTSSGPPATEIPAKTSSSGGSRSEGKTLPVWDGFDQPPSLSPGTYTTEWFTPEFSFEVGEGWASPSGDLPYSLELISQSEADNFLLDGPQYSSLAVNRIDEVFDPKRIGDIPSGQRVPTTEENMSPVPDDFIGWLRKHPYLKTSDPEPATVGGVPGTRIDIEVLPVEDYPVEFCGGEPCLPFANGGEFSSMYFPSGGKNRLIVLRDVEGETVIISSNAYPASDFDSVTADAQKVIDSVKWKAES